MDAFSLQLNRMLVETYRSILKIEEQSIKKVDGGNLSINEFHLLEAVGKGDQDGRTIGTLAQDLGITLPSVTIAINKLEKKGYVDKRRCDQDGRVVIVRLTRQGRRMNSAHRFFHEQMIRDIGRAFTEEEKAVLLKAMNRLNEFFTKKAAVLED